MRKLRGKPLEHNASTGERYVRALQAMVRVMMAETEREVLAFVKQETEATGQDAKKDAPEAGVVSQARKLTNALARKFQSHFAKRARGLAEAMVENIDAVSKSTLHGSLKSLSSGLSFDTSVLSGPIRKTVAESIAANVELISSLATEYQTKIQGAVMRSITTGNGLQGLTSDLEAIKGMTQRRAKNVALDQTRKAYNDINRARMEALGIKKFEWLHSGGGQKPRPEHVEMSGNIYSFDKLPVIDPRTGERGIPGQAPNCRCRMVPVLEFDGGDENVGE